MCDRVCRALFIKEPFDGLYYPSLFSSLPVSELVQDTFRDNARIRKGNVRLSTVSLVIYYAETSQRITIHRPLTSHVTRGGSRSK